MHANAKTLVYLEGNVLVRCEAKSWARTRATQLEKVEIIRMAQLHHHESSMS
jgi:hypothetical protein